MTHSLVLFVRCLKPRGQHAATMRRACVITVDNHDATMSKSVLVDCLGINQGLIEESTQ
jgi:hypothetical protein